jgi:hypothetical protein
MRNLSKLVATLDYNGRRWRFEENPFCLQDFRELFGIGAIPAATAIFPASARMQT